MKNKAQSILEYAILIGVISAALIAMQEYMQRAVNAKLKDVQEELYGQSKPGAEIDPQTGTAFNAQAGGANNFGTRPSSDPTSGSGQSTPTFGNGPTGGSAGTP